MINDKMKIIAEQQSQRVVLKGNTIKDGNTIYSVKSPFYFSTKLPHEYQEVEYIETNGTQYIDTGVMPTNDIGFKLTLKVNSPNDQIICGVQTLFQVGSNEAKIYYGWNGVNTADQYRKNANHDNFHSIEHNYLNSKRALFDNVEDTSHLVAGGYTNLSLVNQTIDLFCRKETNGNNQYFASISLKECKITNGTTLVRDFIPCYRVSDNVIGLYDLVNGQFFTNNGTGAFTKGNNVGLQPLVYIRTKRIDLGTINWAVWNATYGDFWTTLSDANAKPSNQLSNIKCGSLTTITGNQMDTHTIDKTITLYISGTTKYLRARKQDFANASATEFKNSLSGVILEYETAEPLELNGIGTDYDTYENTSGKVVRKIRKVKINDLNWTKVGTEFRVTPTNIKSNSGVTATPQVLCADYNSVSIVRYEILNQVMTQDAKTIKIKDSTYQSVADFKATKGNAYIYYIMTTSETETERSVLVDNRYTKVVDSNGNEIDTD